MHDPWDINAAFWDERMGDEGNDWHLRVVRPAVERLLGPVAGLRVLDVACGNGLFARRLAKLEADVVATDGSERMLDHARRRTPDAQRIDYRRLDVTDAAALLDLGEHTFDAAVCNMALMDIPDIVPLAAALPRLLRRARRSCSRRPTPASTAWESGWSQSGKRSPARSSTAPACSSPAT